MSLPRHALPVLFPLISSSTAKWITALRFSGAFSMAVGEALVCNFLQLEASRLHSEISFCRLGLARPAQW